jgi:predicted permease
MDAWTRDLRYALRQLQRTPVMTAVAAVSVAIAITVAVSAFSLLNAVLFKPMPVPAIDDVHHVYTSSFHTQFQPYGSSSWPDYEDIAASGAFASLTAAYWDRVAVGVWGGMPRIEYLMFVSPNYVSALGLPLLRGRGFSESGREPEIVITETYWKRTLLSDPDVLGTVLRVNGDPITIIGVVRSEFRGTGFGPPLMGWVSAPLLPAITGADVLTQRNMRRWRLVGRLEAGQTPAAVQARLSPVAASLARAHPREWIEPNGEPKRLSVLTHRESLAPPGQRGELITVTVGTSMLVLLIVLLACTNVAGLLLARAAARRHEIAVRLTMGATRARLVRQLLVESMVLGLLGGALGIVTVYWVTRFASRFPILDSFDLQPDWRVLLVALVLSMICALFFGLAPAVQSLRTDVRSGFSGHHGSVRSQVRGSLIAVQVAVSCVLIVLAINAALGVRAHLASDPGIAVDDLLVARLDYGVFARDTAQEGIYFRSVMDLVSSMPGVRSAATTLMLPSGSGYTFASLTRADGEEFPAELNTVGEDYFETTGLRALDGRLPEQRDGVSAVPVGVVNRTFARAWGAPVVGQVLRISNSDAGVLIVGVVPDVRYHQHGDVRPLIYRVAGQAGVLRSSMSSVLIRTQPGAESTVASAIRRAVQERFPDVVTLDIEPLRTRLERDALPQRIAARTALGIGAVELALAMVGLYGLLLFALTARTREMGIRLALGAGPGRASWAVLRGSLGCVAIGAACGLLLGVPAAMIASRELMGSRPTDPVPFVVASLCTLLAAALAAVVPARRASSIEPAVALRHD